MDDGRSTEVDCSKGSSCSSMNARKPAIVSHHGVWLDKHRSISIIIITTMAIPFGVPSVARLDFGEWLGGVVGVERGGEIGVEASALCSSIECSSLDGMRSRWGLRRFWSRLSMSSLIKNDMKPNHASEPHARSSINQSINQSVTSKRTNPLVVRCAPLSIGTEGSRSERR